MKVSCYFVRWLYGDMNGTMAQWLRMFFRQWHVEEVIAIMATIITVLTAGCT